ncbi:MAG: SPOR domain-containing protein [Gemmatimonadota bacterium]|nr:SPOR domain-containing protein [Gemmatimonadota bacterium]
MRAHATDGAHGVTPAGIRTRHIGKAAAYAAGGFGLMVLAAGRLPGQASVTPSARIESLVQAGQDSVALAVADSVLADTDPSAAGYADALYWRGTLRRSPDARLDLIRLTVDYPTHPRTADALYALARQDLASGDSDLALRRMDRIVRDFMPTGVGPRAAADAGRLHLGKGRMEAACAAFDSALVHLPEDQVELRNRTAYDARPCERWKDAQADSIAAAASATKQGKPADAKAPSAGSRGAGRANATESPGGDSSTPGSGRGARAGGPSPPAARWTVQVAAYGTRSEADRLRARLVALGYEARVALESPYRVRVGRFAARQSAADVATKLKRQRFTAIVVEAERP